MIRARAWRLAYRSAAGFFFARRLWSWRLSAWCSSCSAPLSTIRTDRKTKFQVEPACKAAGVVQWLVHQCRSPACGAPSSAFDRRCSANFNAPDAKADAIDDCGHGECSKKRPQRRGDCTSSTGSCSPSRARRWASTLLLADLTITAGSIWIGAGFVAIYGAFAWFNAKVRARKDPQVVFVLGGFAQIVLVTLIMTPFTYIAAATNLPMQDRWLRSLDQALGLDWQAYVALRARPSGARDLDRLRLHDDQVAAVHHPGRARRRGTDIFGCSNTRWHFCSR